MLTGHPEHDLLFVATQVPRAAGLKKPSMAVQGKHSKENGVKLQVGTLSLSLKHRDGRAVPSNSWPFDEPRVYTMLMRGRAPQSEPFRKWVTEEVLPTIRKTGKYDAEQSTNPIAQSVMDELKMLDQYVAALQPL